MQRPLTENLHAVCQALLEAVTSAVPGEILACDLVQIDSREFNFQSVAAAHFPGGPVRRLLMGCETRLAEHFAANGPDVGDKSPVQAGLAQFCSQFQIALADTGLPWVSDQDFLVHDQDQFRVNCDGVRNFLFRVAVAEGRIDLIIDLAPRLLSCNWLLEAIEEGGKTQVGSEADAITDDATVNRIMQHLAESGADVQVKIPAPGDRLELLQATFLARQYQEDREVMSLTCARRTSLESMEDVPERVSLVFILQDKLLQASCPVVGHDQVWLDDDVSLPSLEIGYPDSVTYGQRRGSFRLEPPERITGTVRRVTEEGSTNSLVFNQNPAKVQDISFTGVKLLLGSNTIISGFKGGAEVEVVLELPKGFGTVTLRGVVRRLHINLEDPGRRGASLGVEFTEDQDQPGLAITRKYIENRHTSRLSRGQVELEIG